MNQRNNDNQVIVTCKARARIDLFIPANEKADLLAQFIGKKSFLRQDLTIINKLGFTVIIKQEETNIIKLINKY